MTDTDNEEGSIDLADAGETLENGEGFQNNAVPCTIYLNSGKIFVVEAIGAWGYVPQGVFASGRFKGYSGPDTDVVIPEHSINYIDLDYPRLRKYIAQQQASQAAA